jgi:two-component system sensor histidine kinase BaeS
MRSLSLKIVLAFLVVSLAGTAILAVLTARGTANEFGSFLFDQYQGNILAQLEEYYRTHESWAGVEKTFPFPGGPKANFPSPEFAPGGRFAVVDSKGQVVLAGPGFKHGEKISEVAWREASKILVGDEEVGRMIVGTRTFRVPREGEALINRINQVLLFSALGATVFALLLGVALTRTLTRPLRELTAATRAVAEGDLDQHVPVRSKDELGELAASFNQMNAKLAKSLELRQQMTADIAHELRTPISVILGHTEAVKDGVLPLSDNTFDVIHDEAGRLSRLVDELRTLTLAEAGELQFSPSKISPHTLLKDVFTAYLPQAQQRDINLEMDVEGNLPDIEVDPDRMAQVLGNLISNALRYTPKGGRVILSANDREDRVELSVQDNGLGLDADELERIFDRFYRGDKSRHRDEGGSGLGLTIAKSMVEGQGGRIWAESTPGDGVTFIITFPK